MKLNYRGGGGQNIFRPALPPIIFNAIALSQVCVEIQQSAIILLQNAGTYLCLFVIQRIHEYVLGGF